MDLYFQGVQWFNKGGIENIERARGYFERAVALDPTNVDALVGAARADVLIGAIYTTDERAERLAAAEALLIKGISIAPRNYWAHLWLGFIQILTNRASRAIGEFERALALNRNLGAAHAWIGLAKITMGRAEEAEAHVNEAFRLSPQRCGRVYLGTISRAWRNSISAPTRKRSRCFAAQSTPAATIRSTISMRAAALAHLGRLDEARAEVKAGLGVGAEILDRPVSQHGGERQPDLSRPARAHPRGPPQSRNSGGLTDGSLSFYKG